MPTTYTKEGKSYTVNSSRDVPVGGTVTDFGDSKKNQSWGITPPKTTSNPPASTGGGSTGGGSTGGSSNVPTSYKKTTNPQATYGEQSQSTYDLQKMLNDKYGAGLNLDSKYGP